MGNVAFADELIDELEDIFASVEFEGLFASEAEPEDDEDDDDFDDDDEDDDEDEDDEDDDEGIEPHEMPSE